MLLMEKFRQRNRIIYCNVENNCSLSRDAIQTPKDKREIFLVKNYKKFSNKKVKKILKGNVIELKVSVFN